MEPFIGYSLLFFWGGDLVKIVLFFFLMLPKASSSVYTMFEAHLSLLTAVFNAFSCKQWEPTGSLP